MPNSNWHTISAIGVILNVACKSPILNSASMFLAQYYMFAKMFRVFLACIGLGNMAKKTDTDLTDSRFQLQFFNNSFSEHFRC